MGLRKWVHERKGELEGTLVKDEGAWLTIQLTKESTFKWRGYRVKNAATINGVGEMLVVRREFMKEVT